MEIGVRLDDQFFFDFSFFSGIEMYTRHTPFVGSINYFQRKLVQYKTSEQKQLTFLFNNQAVFQVVEYKRNDEHQKERVIRWFPYRDGARNRLATDNVFHCFGHRCLPSSDSYRA